MNNTQENLFQDTNSLDIAYLAANQKEGKTPKISKSNISPFFFNKNKSIKAEILKENKKVFITENSIHFENNVIIKKNSQFLPKIKNYVNEYQTEKNKLNYWPTTEESNDSSNIFTNFNENIDTNLNNIQKKTISIEYFKLEDNNKNSNNRIENTPKKTFEIMEDKSSIPAISKSGYPYLLSQETKIGTSDPNTYQKKVEISKLNKISLKKGSLINNKVIEHLNSNNENNPNNQTGVAFASVRGKNTTISQYLNTMSITNSKINTSPNLSKKYGVLLKYNKIISYSFLQNQQTVLISPQNNSKYNKEEIEKIITSEIIEETYKLLFFYFKSIYCLISKPVISITPDKVKIQLFYYLSVPKKKIIKLFAIHYLNSFKNKWIKNILNKKNTPKKMGMNSFFYNPSQNSNFSLDNIRLPFIKGRARKSISRLKSKPSFIKNIIFNLIKYNIAKVFSYKFKLICDILSSKFNKTVELELIRLHNPYLDSNILANLLHLIIKNKRKKPKIAIDKIYNKNQVKKLTDPNLISVNNKPAFLSGLNFYINGRTMGEAIVPRMTKKRFEKGATATGKVNILEKSTVTKKNKKGAYTIKVISAQNFY